MRSRLSKLLLLLLLLSSHTLSLWKQERDGHKKQKQKKQRVSPLNDGALILPGGLPRFCLHKDNDRHAKKRRGNEQCGRVKRQHQSNRLKFLGSIVRRLPSIMWCPAHTHTHTHTYTYIYIYNDTTTPNASTVLRHLGGGSVV